jgi:Mce-associated membrane protein
VAIDDDAAQEELSESAASVPDDEDETQDADDDAVEIVDEASEAKPKMSLLRAGLLVGIATLVTLVGAGGWLAFRARDSHDADAQRQLFLQVGRQGALNLTTIDYRHAESDVQRIIDSATGNFYDDFKRRSGPFVEVVKKAEAQSVGTITEAGVESESDSEAQVLVAVSVKTTNAGTPEQTPRAWRMRIAVTKMGDEAKVSNVAFVP